MTDEMCALAKRVVKCKAWRWMPGMRDSSGVRVSRGVAETPEDAFYPGGIRDGDWRVRPDNAVVTVDALPDLTDPATLGCLLALVRESWDDGRLGLCALRGLDGEWRWVVVRQELMAPSCGSGPTEPHALVAALEAAP